MCADDLHDSRGRSRAEELFPGDGPADRWFRGDPSVVPELVALAERMSAAGASTLSDILEGSEEKESASTVGRSEAQADGDAVYLESNAQSCDGVDPSTWLEIFSCRCRSWFCSGCCVSRGLKLRGRLAVRLEQFTGLQMWTLTVDPKLFPSPQAAFEYCRDRRVVSNLVRVLKAEGFLHSGAYFYVVEWQKDTEMVHFHLMLDSSYVPFDRVCEIWNHNRPHWAGPVEGDRPGFGSVRFSVPSFAGPRHAANYACKYLIKFPEQGYPDWVLDFHGNIFRYGISRGFWGGVTDQAAAAKLDAKNEIESAIELCCGDETCFCATCRGDEEQATVAAQDSEADVCGEKETRRSGRTIRERLAGCGGDAIVVRAFRIDGEVGDQGEIGVKRQFRKRLQMPFGEVLYHLGLENSTESIIRVSGADLESLHPEKGDTCLVFSEFEWPQVQ